MHNYSLLLLALLLCEEDDGPELLIKGTLSSGFPSLPPAAPAASISWSKRISPPPSAPAPPFALTLMLRLDLPGFPRRDRPGALTKSVKLEREDVGVCPLRPLPFAEGGACEVGVRTGRR